MNIGMGTDFGGTISGGSTGTSTTPCCTAAQASSTAYANSEDGNLRYDGYGHVCNPNCMDELTYDQSFIQFVQGGTTGKMILIAAAVGIAVLVLAKK